MKNLVCDPALFKKDLNGTVTIVTGANSGTGLATVRQLVSQGAHVIAACRRITAGQEAVASLAGAQQQREALCVGEAHFAELHDALARAVALLVLDIRSVCGSRHATSVRGTAARLQELRTCREVRPHDAAPRCTVTCGNGIA